MTPRKVERGRQPGRGSETSDRPVSRSQSGQKRRSTSQAHDEVDSKKGKMDMGPVGATGGKDRRVLVRINWSNTAIEDRTSRSSQHRLLSQTDPGLLSPHWNLKSSQPLSRRAPPLDPLKLQKHLDTVARHQHGLQGRRMKSLISLPGSSRKTGSLLRKSLFGIKLTTGLLPRQIDWTPWVMLKKPDPSGSLGINRSYTGCRW